MQALCAAPRAPRPRTLHTGAQALTPEERTAVEQGRLFKLLPADLREVILGRAHVWRFAHGEQVLPETGPIDHWLGVASGELAGFTRSLDTGEKLVTRLLSAGVWLNMYSPLCEIPEWEVEFESSGATCLLALHRDDVMDLWARRPELSAALLSIATVNLRYAHLMLHEFQASTLEQKVLRWIDGVAHFHAVLPSGSGATYRNNVSQATLAAASGVSRQSWNAAVARLEAGGMIQRVKGGLVVLDRARLDLELARHGLSNAGSCLEPEVGPVRPAAAMPCEALPIGSLRDEERNALKAMRWYERLSAASRDTLLTSAKVLRPSEGDLLGSAACHPPGWLCVLRGGVRLSIVSAAPAPAANDAPRTVAGRTVLTQLHPGATLFEYSLIDGRKCGLDATSEAGTTLLMIEPAAFHALLEADAGMRLNALQWMGHGHHHIVSTKVMISLPMPLRLHAWLDKLCRQCGQLEGEWLSIPMRLTQSEIAGWIGTTRQYVARAIAGLEGDGRLVRQRDTYLLRRDCLPLASAPSTVREAVADPA